MTLGRDGWPWSAMLDSIDHGQRWAMVHAANSLVLCRLRRVGMAATDTLPGSVIVTGVAVGTY